MDGWSHPAAQVFLNLSLSLISHPHSRKDSRSQHLSPTGMQAHPHQNDFNKKGRKEEKEMEIRIKWMKSTFEGPFFTWDSLLPLSMCASSRSPRSSFPCRCAKFILTQNAWMCLPLWHLHRPLLPLSSDFSYYAPTPQQSSLLTLNWTAAGSQSLVWHQFIH